MFGLLFRKTTKKCGLPSCTRDSLSQTSYCLMHITLNNEQHLFNSCTAKFSDNSPCSVPVFHINRDLPLCREHAWKKVSSTTKRQVVHWNEYFLFGFQDNYSRLLQEQKPKKPTRKKPKPSAMTRSPKRNKKKRKVPQQKHVQIVSSSSVDHLLSNDSSTRSDSMQMFANAQTQQLVKLPQHKHSQPQHEYLRHQPTKHIQREIQVIRMSNDMFTTVCENSSAYESSEDTGVGGLSETELIGGVPDGIFFCLLLYLLQSYYVLSIHNTIYYCRNTTGRCTFAGGTRFGYAESASRRRLWLWFRWVFCIHFVNWNCCFVERAV